MLATINYCIAITKGYKRMTQNTQDDTPKRKRGRPRKDYVPRLINVQPDVNAWINEVHERTKMPITAIVNTILAAYFAQRKNAK